MEGRDRLTGKQKQVFHYLLATSMSEKEIGHNMGLTRSGVAQHSKAVYAKLQVTGRIELMHQEIVRLIEMLGEAERKQQRYLEILKRDS